MSVVIIAIIATFSASFVLIEWVKRRWSVDSEVSRKSAHVVSAVGAAALPAVATYPEIAVASGFFIPVMAVSKSRGLFSAVHDVRRSTLGEVYFPASVCLMALLFPYALPYVFGLLTMGIADAAANIAGRRFGRGRYRFLGASKSHVGSAAFAAVTFCIAVLSLVSFTGGLPLAGLLGTAAVATLLLTAVEAGSGYGIDNVTVPLAGGAVMHWLV